MAALQTNQTGTLPSSLPLCFLSVELMRSRGDADAESPQSKAGKRRVSAAGALLMCSRVN